jgi:hypothetical protein
MPVSLSASSASLYLFVMGVFSVTYLTVMLMF